MGNDIVFAYRKRSLVITFASLTSLFLPQARGDRIDILGSMAGVSGISQWPGPLRFNNTTS